MDFRDPHAPAVVCVETLTGTHYLEKPAELDIYRRAFAQFYNGTRSIESTMAAQT